MKSRQHSLPCAQLLSGVRLFAAPRTIACRVPLFMGLPSKNITISFPTQGSNPCLLLGRRIFHHCAYLITEIPRSWEADRMTEQPIESTAEVPTQKNYQPRAMLQDMVCILNQWCFHEYCVHSRWNIWVWELRSRIRSGSRYHYSQSPILGIYIFWPHNLGLCGFTGPGTQRRNASSNGHSRSCLGKQSCSLPLGTIGSSYQWLRPHRNECLSHSSK